MFSRLFFALTLLLSLSLQVSAHALIAPALGVQGTGARKDVQRPSTAKPCGNANIAQTIATSQAAQANAQGVVALTVTNFNSGKDGSRFIKSVKVDPTGTGKSFVAATMVTNGVEAPTDVTSQQLTVQLPANTKCTGTGGRCLISLTTDGGFGNCVAVQQGATTNAAATKGAKAAKAKRDVRAVGSRAARAMRRALEEFQEWM
ncbi:hypothetical protein BDY19DRAFT_250717 [Irpex rosettiformis]|uniref:Uncharacterized protein n=1 Tax=Irpex rosettiformis TaxID=378272 RepID=A0ACB8TZJ6_9APHY|nr:hypothetical protein BDY19DRAFT_250717 [Irpex rosettiformis]